MEPYHRYASLLRVLANPDRLNLLDLLLDRELTVPEIQQWVSLDYAILSRHLAILRQTGLVKERRTGRVLHYSSDAEMATALFEVIDRASHLNPHSRSKEDSLLR